MRAFFHWCSFTFWPLSQNESVVAGNDGMSILLCRLYEWNDTPSIMSRWIPKIGIPPILCVRFMLQKCISWCLDGNSFELFIQCDDLGGIFAQLRVDFEEMNAYVSVISSWVYVYLDEISQTCHMYMHLLTNKPVICEPIRMNVNQKASVWLNEIEQSRTWYPIYGLL